MTEQLGLKTAGIVMIGVLVIAVISILGMLILPSLLNSVEQVDVNPTNFYNFSTTLVMNESVTASSPSTIDGITGLRNCQLVSYYVINKSNSIAISEGNYTVSGCTLYVSSSNKIRSTVNNTVWNVSGVYTYDTTWANSLVQNETGGVASFFTVIPTIFSLLGVVVLILAIAVIVIVASRFGGSSGSGEGI